MKRNSHLFMGLLKGSGFNCVSFTDLLLVLKHFSSNSEKYSIVITDLRMPGISGLQLAKRIREYNSKVKILLITAFYPDEIFNDDDFKQANILNIIEKPVRLAELRTHVIELCNGC